MAPGGNRLTRRTALTMGVALAGCVRFASENERNSTGNPESDTDNGTNSTGDADADSDPTDGTTLEPDTSSPTAIVESFYDKVQTIDSDASGEEYIDEVDPYLHSKSPLRDLLRDQQDDSDGESRTIQSVDVELGEEDLSATELEDEFGLSIFDVEDAVIESIVEENAVVMVTIEYEDAETEQVDRLTVTEDGEWVIFG